MKISIARVDLKARQIARLKAGDVDGEIGDRPAAPAHKIALAARAAAKRFSVPPGLITRTSPAWAKTFSVLYTVARASVRRCRVR